ncbi:unnamed protein product [Gongylonema pulchrum]|uniref:TOG domain-containing protein n=1 Tax=Gongylonema pulchrum TaxID=637853 RepID=A0A3P7NWQ4_9BILA|nr:unnamed protein product [Gongylonema pulchrum]
MKAVADIVIPLLADPKRRVRLAAFELFAVLAQLFNGSTESLLKSVADFEQKHRAYGLFSAVKIRILRKTLPRIRSDGLIEYAIPLGLDVSLNRGWTSLKTDNLDYDWIMSGSCGSSSALSRQPSLLFMHFCCAALWQRYSAATASKNVYCREAVCVCVSVYSEATFISASRKAGRLNLWVYVPTPCAILSFEELSLAPPGSVGVIWVLVVAR